MTAESISALSTAVIAFVTIIVAMVGFYYNLKSAGLNLQKTLFFEGIFALTPLLFVLWVKRRVI